MEISVRAVDVEIEKTCFQDLTIMASPLVDQSPCVSLTYSKEADFMVCRANSQVGPRGVELSGKYCISSTMIKVVEACLGCISPSYCRIGVFHVRQLDSLKKGEP